MAGRLFLGTSGHVYGHWRGVFYPPRLPSREWLPFNTRHFASVELNNPFYRLPSKAVFRAWRAAVPDDFVFAVKASRFLTHLKRLKAPTAPLDRFFRRVRLLGPTLGPILFQLPSQFHVHLPRLARFLRALERQRHVNGTRSRYHGAYTEAMLRADARRIRGWLADGLDVYVISTTTAAGRQ